MTAVWLLIFNVQSVYGGSSHLEFKSEASCLKSLKNITVVKKGYGHPYWGHCVQIYRSK